MKMKLIDICGFNELNSLNYQWSLAIKIRKEEDSNIFRLYSKRESHKPFHKYENFNGFYKPCVRILDRKNT